MRLRTRSEFRCGRARERGQGIVEFIVAIGTFGALLLGIFQVALLYRAKTTVDYAAFMAAREGSLNGATQTSVDDGMVKGLMPLYATNPNAAGLLEAWGKAKLAEGTYDQATAEIVSPTRAMFNQVEVEQFDGVKAIPNDDLAYRDDATRAANLLKVKVTYAYPLIVPVVDKVIGELAGRRELVMDANGLPRMMYVLPIEATAIVQMQSPIRDPGALGTGSGGNPGNGGGGGNYPLPPPSSGGGNGGNPPSSGPGEPPVGGGQPPTHPICTGHL